MIKATIHKNGISTELNGSFIELCNDTLNLVKGIRDAIKDDSPFHAEMFEALMKIGIPKVLSGEWEEDGDGEEDSFTAVLKSFRNGIS